MASLKSFLLLRWQSYSICRRQRASNAFCPVAASLAVVVKCVIATSAPISNDTAIAFSYRFYNTLTRHCSVEEATKEGNAEIALCVLTNPTDPQDAQFAIYAQDNDAAAVLYPQSN